MLDIINKIWKFFASVQLTVVVLLTLAGTSIIGTLIPQNENPMDYIQTFGEFTYKLFSVLGLFDMYHAWWFLLLLLTLTVNIVVCSVERFPATWKIVTSRKKGGNPGRYRKLANRQTFSVSRPAAEIQPVLANALAGQFKAPRLEST